jgi:hypothetical protein
MAQALQFAQDFKLGHYMRIPPRTMFFAQVSAAAIAETVQLGVQAWMFTTSWTCVARHNLMVLFAPALKCSALHRSS